MQAACLLPTGCREGQIRRLLSHGLLRSHNSILPSSGFDLLSWTGSLQPINDDPVRRARARSV